MNPYSLTIETGQGLPDAALESVGLETPPRVIRVDGDPFDGTLDTGALDRLFARMALHPRHAFQVLTERPERMLEWLTGEIGEHMRSERVGELVLTMSDGEVSNLIDWPLPNVWLGVRVEDQEQADARVPVLLRCPAALRFLSCEPLLGAVDLDALNHGGGEVFDVLRNVITTHRGHTFVTSNCMPLDWITVGGGAGPDAPACDVAWVRSILAQCKDAGVPAFVTRLGSRVRMGFDEWNDGQRLDGKLIVDGETIDWTPLDETGANPDEWPDDLRVREFPKGGGDA